MDVTNLKKIERMMIDFKDEIKEEFRHQLGIQSEAFQHKLDLVVEGHQMLSEKLDRVEERLDSRIDCVVKKLDAVTAQGDATAAKLDAIAADLVAHRRDTEAHSVLDKVKEGN